MILIFIGAISLIQLAAYLILDHTNLQRGKLIVFLCFLLAHLFLFPRFFYPEPDPDGVNCGMPILGITLAFWIFGGFTSLLTHIGYKYLSK